MQGLFVLTYHGYGIETKQLIDIAVVCTYFSSERTDIIHLHAISLIPISTHNWNNDFFSEQKIVYPLNTIGSVDFFNHSWTSSIIFLYHLLQQLHAQYGHAYRKTEQQSTTRSIKRYKDLTNFNVLIIIMIWTNHWTMGFHQLHCTVRWRESSM